MQSNKLSTRIKELRQRKGWSQEELSDKCGLSLRTIQRIETGETEPLGDSLRKLALAFDIDPSELTDWQLKEDQSSLLLLNLSALSFVLFPLLGIIIPLTIWSIKKGKVKQADHIGKKLLNFQITWNMILFLLILTMILQSFFNIEIGLSVLMVMLIGLALYIFNGTVVLINTIRTTNDKKVYYMPALKILD